MANRRKNLGPVQRFVSWVRSFRRVDGIELPDDGRSSVESNQGLGLGTLAFGSVIPPFDIEMLPTLKKLWVENPDFSQFVSNAESLGNTGHQLTVDAADEAKAEAALNRLNQSASRIYPNGAGVDGLINAELDQLAWSGALSSEDVVDFAGRRVKRVVLVPPEQIRFRLIDGEYVPHQQAPFGALSAKNRAQSALGLIPLNPETYHYFAVQTIDNSPYAKPTASAAVDLMKNTQAAAIGNLDYIVQKFGLLGLVIASLTKPPRKPNETESEYVTRAQKWLTSVAKSLDGNITKGLLVAFNDIKWEHANVASDGRGAGEVFQVIEELCFSGMNSMAAFHGRNYTTTETFADVIYSILTAQVVNRQRLVKRRREQTYRLDLLLAGIEVDGLSMKFNAVESRNEKQKAEAAKSRWDVVKEKVASGVISPDEGAQELGYESWFDEELIVAPANPISGVGEVSNSRLGLSRAQGFSATFRFDRQGQRYRFVPPRIEIASLKADESTADNVVPLKKRALG